MGSFTEECMAAITELHAVIISGNNVADKWKALAQFQKQYAKGLAIETRMFREFKSRRVRAGFHKILTRLEVFKDFVCAEKPISDSMFTMAENWTRHQLSETYSVAAAAADIDVVDPGGLAFVGFRRVTRKDKQALSFADEPPPWLFHFSIEIQDMDDKSKQECLAHNRPKVETMSCLKHGRPAHVYFTGRTGGDFTIEIESCCNEFSKSVHGKLVPSRGR